MCLTFFLVLSLRQLLFCVDHVTANVVQMCLIHPDAGYFHQKFAEMSFFRPFRDYYSDEFPIIASSWLFNAAVLVETCCQSNKEVLQGFIIAQGAGCAVVAEGMDSC